MGLALVDFEREWKEREGPGHTENHPGRLFIVGSAFIVVGFCFLVACLGKTGIFFMGGRGEGDGGTETGLARRWLRVRGGMHHEHFRGEWE